MRQNTRLKFNQMCDKLAASYGVPSMNVQFAVEPTLQQRLQDKIVEQSTFLPKINIVPVDELAGENVLGSASGPVSGRSDTTKDSVERVPRDVLGLVSYKYQLKQTNSDVFMRYATMDAWAKFPDMAERYARYVQARIANDRELVGWYGTSAADTTDLSSNPLLQDVNKGWLQYIRDAIPQNILAEGETTGELRIGSEDGADWANLDVAVNDLVQGIPTYMLKLLIQDTAGLAKNIDDLGKIKGMETTTNMARKMVDPFMKLEAGINTVSVAWWQKLLPPLNDVVDVFNVFMGKILWAIEEFPNIARWIGYAALAVTVFAGVMGLASIASGLMKLGVLGIISPFGKLCGVLKWFLEIMSLVKAAILANPLLFIVYGAALAVAGIAWLVSNWEEFKASYGDTWWGQAIIAVVQDICAWWERLTSAFSNGEWGKFLLEAINLVTAPLRTLMEGIGWVLEKMGLIKSDSAYYKLTKPLEASTFTGEEGATASPQYQAQAEKALVGYELYGMGVPSPVPSVPAQSAPQALQRQSEVMGRPAQQTVMQAQGQVARFERAGVREAYRPQLINAVSAPTQPRMPSLEMPRIPAPQSRSIYNTLNNSNTNRSQNKTMTIGAQYFNFEGPVTREKVEEMMAMSFD